MPEPTEPVEPTEPQEPKEPAPQDPQEPKEPKDKLVPLAEVQAVRKRAREAEAKLAEYQAKEAEAERAKMSEIERYKADLDAANGRIKAFEVNTARSEAVSKAIAEVGDGWAVDPAAVNAIAQDLAYDEKTYAEKVKRVVESVKKPKMGGGSPIPGIPANGNGHGAPAFQQGQKLTSWQVAKLSPDEARAYNDSQKLKL